MSERTLDPTLTAPIGREERPPAPPARLRALFPPGLDFEARLDERAVTIGRGAEGAGRLRHATVSRAHFEIAWDARQRCHTGRDLGSRNGARVGGVRVGERPVALADNAVVRIGDVLLVYEQGRGLAVGEAPEVSRAAAPGLAAKMRTLRAALARAAPDPAPCLVVGPTGSGKERVADEIHRLSGRRGPLVKLNCAAISAELVESQLFGHVRGAFTGAQRDHEGYFRAADGGTLFLDEIGELPLALQPKLLRALQQSEVQPVGDTRTHRVDVRVVAATHQPLALRADEGAFRRDLYARLALWELHLPSLAERRVDLLDWVDRLNRDWHARRGETARPLGFDADAAERLLITPWPENLRGLDRLVHQLATDPPGPVTLERLRERLPEPAVEDAPASSGPPTRDELVAALERCGSIRATARYFGKDKKQIHRWMDQHGLRD